MNLYNIINDMIIISMRFWIMSVKHLGRNLEKNLGRNCECFLVERKGRM